MAVFRQVHVSFWQDPYIIELESPDHRLFYLYLMTNNKTTQCGIYELSMRFAVIETGLTKEKVDELLNHFMRDKKILFDPTTREIMLLNWLKFNPIFSPKIQSCIVKELKTIKNEDFKRLFINLSQKEKFPLSETAAEELDDGDEDIHEEQQDEENPLPYVEIISYLNQKCSAKYRSTTPATKTLIRARWRQGFRLDDFKTVVDNKSAEWMGTDMAQYLRPETLFGNKFEGYLNQKARTGIQPNSKPRDPEIAARKRQEKFDEWVREGHDPDTEQFIYDE
jgi:uncharacterized phage protein (TIGR02220 family)